MSPRPSFSPLHPDLSRPSCKGPLRLLAGAGYLGNAEAVRRATSEQLDARSLGVILQDPTLVVMLASNPQVGARHMGEILRRVLAEVEEADEAGRGLPLHLLGLLDALVARGLPLPAEGVEEALDTYWTLTGSRRARWASLLLRLPTPRVDAEMLGEIFQDMPTQMERRGELLSHPAAGPALWHRMLDWAEAGEESSRRTGILSSLAECTEALAEPRVQQSLLGSDNPALMVPVLVALPVARFREAFLSLPWTHPRTAPLLLEALPRIPETSLRNLRREDWGRLLESSSAELRLQAIGWIGKLSPPSSPGPSERRRQEGAPLSNPALGRLSR